MWIPQKLSHIPKRFMKNDFFCSLPWWLIIHAVIAFPSAINFKSIDVKMLYWSWEIFRCLPREKKNHLDWSGQPASTMRRRFKFPNRMWACPVLPYVRRRPWSLIKLQGESGRLFRSFTKSVFKKWNLRKAMKGATKAKNRDLELFAV